MEKISIINEVTVMQTAAQLMKKKRVFKAEIDRIMSGDQSDAIWKESTEKLQSIMDRYGKLPPGVQSHTDRIFLAAAIYLTVKKNCGVETAYRIIEDGAINGCAVIQPKLAKIMKLPGMPSLFVKLWDPMTKKKFGPACGFRNKFYPKKKGEYKMDILECPYNRYFTELGCPELTKVFCDNDERMYGNLAGIKFERQGTIGKGADHCDFYVRNV